ncbi:Uncharacterized protein Adt_13318 [Abeliophyllum distichum]|uniref:Uncharacterized protein n=1 Tax=Abeliophyllum distichum TaxID=126358 RepID=A0ABD1TWH0_9LAMI
MSKFTGEQYHSTQISFSGRRTVSQYTDLQSHRKSHLQLISDQLRISTGETPVNSQFTHQSSQTGPPPTLQRPQLRPTQQQPKPKFITTCATPTIHIPPPTTATTSLKISQFNITITTSNGTWLEMLSGIWPLI